MKQIKTWIDLYKVTRERILESEELLVGNPKLDFIIEKTIDINMRLNDIAREHLNVKDQEILIQLRVPLTRKPK